MDGGVRVSCNQFDRGGLCLKGTPMEMEEMEEVKRTEAEIVITLQDIAEVAMTGAGEQGVGCQREEDDNQLDSDLSKVAFFPLLLNLNHDFVCSGCQRNSFDK